MGFDRKVIEMILYRTSSRNLLLSFTRICTVEKK